MKCKFEHNGYCCNSGTFRFKDTCDIENCGHCVPMSRGDVLRTSSDKELANFLSSVVNVINCPERVWVLYNYGLSYKDAWMKWLQEPYE